VLLAVALFLSLNLLLPTTFGSIRTSLLVQSSVAVTAPPVILQTGTAGSSLIYANSTSAKVNVGALNWLGGWDKRVKITINSSDIDETLIDFPVLVYLSNSSSGENDEDVSCVFSEIGSSFKRMAVTLSDGATQCYVEVEKWDGSNQKAWLWIKVPSISSTKDTVLYLYYDKDHADNTGYVGDTGSSAAQSVWDSSFKGVWHLSETSGGIGAIKDSTPNNNSGTDYGNPAFNANGLVNSAISFDGIDDFINMSNSASLQFIDSLTIEAWAKLSSFGSGADVDALLRKGEANPNDYQLAVHDQRLELIIEEDDDGGLHGSTTLSATTWLHLVGTWNGTTRKVYLNGTEDGSGSKTGTITPDTRAIYIGGRAGTDLSTGIIDEVRASNKVRSAAWIKASYESEIDDLIDFGSEETNIEDYVDDNSSNVDSHTGHGTSSNFTAQQDSNIAYNDTLTEADTKGYDISSDFVDGNNTNEDSHAGHGTSSNFTAQKDTDLSFNDTLTEVDTASGTSTGQFGSTSGSSYTSVSAGQMYGSRFTSSADTSTAKNLTFYGRSSTGTANVKGILAFHDNLTIVTNGIGNAVACSTTAGYWVSTFATPPILFPNTVYVLMCIPDATFRFYYGTGTTNQGHADTTNSYASPTSPTDATHNNYAYRVVCNYTQANYELDLEFDYSSANYTSDNEYLCVRTHTFNANGTTESLGIDVRSGGAWVSISASLTASQWNNISISNYLAAGTISFRFIGKTESTDGTQNTWTIECNLIHVWNNSNYELDLEFQWTTIDYAQTYEYVCIHTGSTFNAESMIVKWRNGGSWTTLVTMTTANTWYNTSLAFTSATLTLQFLGGTESSDTSQSTWDIECSLVHVWSSIEVTHDYVLGVNNTITSPWQVRLKEYSSSGIARLQNCTISFHNSTDGTSNQIVIENGSFTTQTGSWYNLGSLETIYIAMTVRASSMGTSYIYAYLEVLIPSTTTYAQYITTFEVN